MKPAKSALRKTGEVNLSSVRLRGDWKDGLNQKTVERIRRSIRRGRAIPPIALDPQKWLLYGRHRYAAHLAEKCKRIRADVVVFESEADLEAAQLEENLNRNVADMAERDRMMARLVELTGERIEGEVSRQRDEKPAAKAGRPESPQRAAIREVAESAGVSESTVERAVRRQQEPAEPPSADPPPREPDPIRSLGAPITANLADGARRAQAVIDQADKDLRKLQGLLKGLDSLPLFPRSLAQELHAAAHDLAAMVRAARPVAVCPWCKNVDRLKQGCHACGGAGYATEERMGNVPTELLDEARVLVMDGGNFRLRSESCGLVDKALEDLAAKGARKAKDPIALLKQPLARVVHFEGTDASSNASDHSACGVLLEGGHVVTNCAEDVTCDACIELGATDPAPAEPAEEPPPAPAQPAKTCDLSTLKEGDLVTVVWDPQGRTKRARFVRLNKAGNPLVEVERVDAKGHPRPGEWGAPRTLERKDVVGLVEQELSF